MTEESCCGGSDDTTAVAADGDIAEGDDPGHALPDEDLQYPTLEFDEGELTPDDNFSVSKEMGRDEMGAWAEDLAGALSSHDLGVETPEEFLTFGVAPSAVDVSFDTDDDEDHRGELEITFRLSAKRMFFADDEAEKVGSRGSKGFVPLSMLTGDRDVYRCYSWIEDPENPD